MLLLGWLLSRRLLNGPIFRLLLLYSVDPPIVLISQLNIIVVSLHILIIIGYYRVWSAVTHLSVHRHLGCPSRPLEVTIGPLSKLKTVLEQLSQDMLF